MSIKIHMLTLGIAQTNCYIVGDEQTHDALIIDAPDDAPRILSVVECEGWTVREILATHSHFDHVLVVRDLKAVTNATFRLHRADLEQLHTLPQVMERFTGQPVPPAPEPEQSVEEAHVIGLGSIH